jgi:hypothetical protein
MSSTVHSFPAASATPPLASLRRWFRRRTRLPRLLVSRVPRGARQIVGTCAACGVAFEGPRSRQADVEQVLRAHQRICPGGDRAGEMVTPFE